MPAKYLTPTLSSPNSYMDTSHTGLYRVRRPIVVRQRNQYYIPPETVERRWSSTPSIVVGSQFSLPPCEYRCLILMAFSHRRRFGDAYCVFLVFMN